MLVFTNGLGLSPRARAFRATSPAPTITEGFEVLVHEVIAAITTAPWPMVDRSPLVPTSAVAPIAESERP